MMEPGKFTDGTTSVLPSTYFLNALGVIAEDLNGDGFKDLYICDRSTGNNLKDVLLLRDFVDGTNNFENKSASIKLFPKPVKGHFTVEIPFEFGAPISFKIFDVSGRAVSIIKPESINGNQFRFNFSKLENHISSGNYFLQILSDGEIFNVEFSVN